MSFVLASPPSDIALQCPRVMERGSTIPSKTLMTIDISKTFEPLIMKTFSTTHTNKLLKVCFAGWSGKLKTVYPTSPITVRNMSGIDQPDEEEVGQPEKPENNFLEPTASHTLMFNF